MASAKMSDVKVINRLVTYAGPDTRGGKTAEALAAETGLAVSTVRKALRDLARRGRAQAFLPTEGRFARPLIWFGGYFPPQE